MANMLYNGVELPDIESVWTDKLLYPYAYIGYDEQDGHLLVFVGTPLWHNGNALVFLSNANVKMHGLVNSVWGEGGTGEFPALTELAMPFIWASKDIEYIDTAGGGIYLAASDPVDPNAPTGPVIDLDFWRMAAMGMFLKSVVWGKKATMYSYNGVVLPALPETELPYAVITYRAERTDMLGYAFTTHTWWLHLVSTIELFDADSGAAFVVNEGDQYYKMKWIENDDGTTSGTKTDWGEVQDHTAGNTILLSEAIWSNTNLYSTDGSLALAASDPIPVYE